MSIPKSLCEIVRQRAQFQCEYCHYLELLSSAPLSIDHIQPQSLGGSDDLNNLALACRRCNERRYNFTTGIDPETETEVALFNPRQQKWSDHFIWSADALQVILRQVLCSLLVQADWQQIAQVAMKIIQTHLLEQVALR